MFDDNIINIIAELVSIYSQVKYFHDTKKTVFIRQWSNFKKEITFIKSIPQTICYTRNDKFHKTNGPAIINLLTYSKEWWIDGVNYNKNGPSLITYYLDRTIQYEYYTNERGEVHRNNGPAVIKYFSCGRKEYEKWYENGKLHNNNGPSVIEYFTSNRKKCEKWYKNGEPHNDNGPALIDYLYREEQWFQNGLNHDPSPNQAAVIIYYENNNKKQEIFYSNGQIHRAKGPSIISYSYNGKVIEEYYCKNNITHRDDGPARIQYYSNGNIWMSVFYKFGKIHRTKRSAIMQYYENGKIKEKNWLNKNKPYKGPHGFSIIKYNDKGDVIFAE